MFTENAQLFMYIINCHFVLLTSVLFKKKKKKKTKTKRSDVFVFSIQGLQDIWNVQDLLESKEWARLMRNHLKVCASKNSLMIGS